MALNEQFATDKKLETKGIVIDYGSDRITIARAGGANKAFGKMLERETRPLKRALIVGVVDNDRANAILRKVYAKTVILNWEVNVGTDEEENWQPGIDPTDCGKPAGDLLPVTEENVLAALTHLSDLFADLQSQASAGALFRAELNEGILEN